MEPSATTRGGFRASCRRVVPSHSPVVAASFLVFWSSKPSRFSSVNNTTSLRCRTRGFVFFRRAPPRRQALARYIYNEKFLPTVWEFFGSLEGWGFVERKGVAACVCSSGTAPNLPSSRELCGEQPSAVIEGGFDEFQAIQWLSLDDFRRLFQ